MKNTKIKIIKGTEETILDINNLDKSELSNKIMCCHHAENQKNNTDYSVRCCCNENATMVVKKISEKGYTLYPKYYSDHKDCIFYKDKLFDSSTILKNVAIEVIDNNGNTTEEEIEEVVSFPYKKRRIQNEEQGEAQEEVQGEAPTNESEEEKALKNDGKANLIIQNKFTLGTIFTKVINDRYEFCVKQGFRTDFYSFFKGLDYTFKRNAIGKSTIYEQIRKNKIAFGKIIELTLNSQKNGYSVKIQSMNFVNSELKYGKNQYVSISLEEYEAASDYYSAMNISIFDKIKDDNENFYFIGLIKPKKNLTKKNLECNNVYFLSSTNQGLITDSLFESRIFNRLYNEGITSFYKPTSITYTDLDFTEYNKLADLIIYNDFYQTKKGERPNQKKYFILECFGINYDTYYTKLKNEKIELGNAINKKYDNIKFLSIDRNNEITDLENVIKTILPE